MTDHLLARLAPAFALAALALPDPARAGPPASVSGSVYLDYWGITDWALVPGHERPDAQALAARTPSGLTAEASLKVNVDIHDELSFAAKACISCHGVEFEHAALDYMPSARFNVQAGRIAVPFGEYANRVDPSGHRTASAPLVYDMGRMAYGERSAMNLGVVPMPYVDTGVLVYGQFFVAQTVQVWYGAYGVAGFKGANDFDFISMRSLPYGDNNRLPAGGLRVALTYASDPGALIGDTSLGASFTTGRYDKAGKLGYRIWGADATLRVWRLLLRGEYVERKTDVNPDAPGYRFEVVDPWFRKSGWYVELEHPLGSSVGMVYRVDQLARSGVPLPSSQAALSTDGRIRRYTVGAVVAPAPAIYAKLSFEYWEPTDFPAFESFHVGLGGSF